jgi:hypothetical protein
MQQNPSPSVSVGAIAGIAISAAAVLATIIGAAIYFRRKHKTTPSERYGLPDQGWWQEGGITDKPNTVYPYHEPFYNHQTQEKPEELDSRQRKPLAELPYTSPRRSELS